MNPFSSARFHRLPDVVLFDLDNTFYPYDPAHRAGQDAVLKKIQAAHSISPADFDKAFDQARQQVKARLGKTAASHHRLLYFQRTLEVMGLGSQVLLALDLEQTYWRTFLRHAALFEEVQALLDDLRLLGIPMIIVTDLTAQIQFRKLVYLGLDSYFDAVVTSEEAGFDKPHPAPFELAIQKLQPQGTVYWMVGDNPVNDVHGARAAIAAITLQKIHAGVTPGTGDQTPDAHFHHFSELRALIKKLSS